MAYAWGTTPMAMRDATLAELAAMLTHLEKVAAEQRKAAQDMRRKG